MSEPIATGSDVRIVYRPKRRLLHKAPEPRAAVMAATFRIEAGEALGVVGESGSGKTTLAMAMLGLVPIESGDLTVAGRRIKPSVAPRKRMNRDVQIVWQNPSASLTPSMKVGELLAETYLAAGRKENRAALTRRILRTLDQVGLSKTAAERFPHEFSGGQRQRIAIARALVSDPKLLVLDEPVSALDVLTQAQVLNLLRTLREETGVSYLLISHDLGVVRYLCDNVLVLENGVQREYGQVDAVCDAPADGYTRKLVDSILDVPTDAAATLAAT